MAQTLSARGSASVCNAPQVDHHMPPRVCRTSSQNVGTPQCVRVCGPILTRLTPGLDESIERPYTRQVASSARRPYRLGKYPPSSKKRIERRSRR